MGKLDVFKREINLTEYAAAGDTSFMIPDSGIDALSYAALHPGKAARYASTSGAMNPNQPALLPR
jgi:hypothetical protein